MYNTDTLNFIIREKDKSIFVNKILKIKERINDMKKSEKRFIEFEIRKNWLVLVEIEKADNGEIGFWLKHKNYGVMDFMFGLIKPDAIKFLKEGHFEPIGFKASDLNYDDEESVLEFSNIFLHNLINQYIEIYVDDVFTEDEKDSYFG